MNITRKTRGTQVKRNQQRILLYWNPKDEKERDVLVKDLLSLDAGFDCMVSWFETSDGDIDETLLRQELLGTQVIVLLVTNSLLTDVYQKGKPQAFEIASELGVSIFPITYSNSLLSDFTELFGSIHCISMQENRSRVKLKAQMELFLGSQALRDEIGKVAFTAEIFLSYRRLDLEEALSFMETLHSKQGLEGIAVWYDNYLTPGLKFDEEIQQAIVKADAFVLLVTPRIVDKSQTGEENYVVREEVPFASKQNKDILPMEAAATDKAKFAVVFPSIAEPISLDRLEEVFRHMLGEKAYVHQLGSERAYCLGMAYLYGHMVEKNMTRAIDMLSLSAGGEDMASCKAAGLLGELFSNGGAVEQSYIQAQKWFSRAASVAETVFGNNHIKTMLSYQSAAKNSFMAGDYVQSITYGAKAAAIFTNQPDLSNMSDDLYFNAVEIYNCLADASLSLKDYNAALTYCQVINQLYEENNDINGAYNKTVLDSMLLKAQILSTGAYEKYDLQAALQAVEHELRRCEQLLGEKDACTAYCLDCLAKFYGGMNNHQEAVKCFTRAIEIAESLFGSEDAATADYYDNFAIYYAEECNDFEKALEWHEKAIQARIKVYGEMHQRVFLSRINLGATFFNAQKEVYAYAQYGEAYRIGCQLYGEISPHMIVLYKNYKELYYRRKLYVMEEMHKTKSKYIEAINSFSSRDRDFYQRKLGRLQDDIRYNSQEELENNNRLNRCEAALKAQRVKPKRPKSNDGKKKKKLHLFASLFLIIAGLALIITGVLSITGMLDLDVGYAERVFIEIYFLCGGILLLACFIASSVADRKRRTTTKQTEE